MIQTVLMDFGTKEIGCVIPYFEVPILYDTKITDYLCFNPKCQYCIENEEEFENIRKLRDSL